MSKTGKRYKTISEGLDGAANYPIDEAIKLVKEKAKAKFNETIEISFNLGIDPKQTEPKPTQKTTPNLPKSTPTVDP